MNYKRILINILLLTVLFVLLMLCFATHTFDGVLDVIAIGMPLWVFLILVLLIANIYYQSQILKTLQSFNRPDPNEDEDEQ